MISSIVSRLVILVFGTLYPAYASYKAVRTKNVKEYVKWMMYWIVFALFTCAETFTDVFLSFWFPFYYEIKIILVLWLLSPATKGSSILYRKFVHPMLSRREQEIDEYIAKAKEQGYSTVLHLGTKGVNYATSVIMQTAIKNLSLPTTISSHSLLPASGGRVRTTSAPGDEPDFVEDLEVKKARRRSRSLADTHGHKRGQDTEVPVSDIDEETDTSILSVQEMVKVVPEKGRTKKTKKSKPTVTTRSSKQMEGGGGLVQQLRRSYSLSDLSTDTDMPDVNRNSKNKMLSNIPDEDLEETDDVSMDNHRVRRTRGYSPRRSASGSGRVEMYFPEVDVDVRQHGSHSRDASLTLSQIRSSEDVSSGYSSAEPLYSGHHPTRSEGLATSREPLVRTASVGGASRTARTRSARGGAVPKRASPAEDSEQWDGDEAASPIQEQILYHVSSPAPPPLSSIPLQRSLSQTEVILLLQQLNSASISSSQTETFESDADKQETLLLVSKENSETQGEKDTSSNAPLVSEENSENIPKTPFLSKENDSSSDTQTALQNIESNSNVAFVEKCNLPYANELGKVSIAENEEGKDSGACDTFIDAEEDPQKVEQENKENLEIFLDTLPALTNETSTVETSISVSESTIMNTTSVGEKSFEIIPIHVENIAGNTLAVMSEITPENSPNSIIEKIAESSPVVANETTAENALASMTETSEEKVSASENEATVENPPTLIDEQPAENAMSLITSAESTDVSPVKISSEELCDQSLPTEKPENYDIAHVEQDAQVQISDNEESTSIIKPVDEFVSSEKNDYASSVLENVQLIENVPVSSVSMINDSQDILITKVEAKDTVHSVVSAEQETGNISNIIEDDKINSSQCSLSTHRTVSVKGSSECVSESYNEDAQSEKKEVRSGRYHKLHAPSPPPISPKMSNVDSDNTTKIASADSVSEAKAPAETSEHDESETAVTARLVLQPGVVKTFASEPANTASNEKFVSSSPKSKKKPSKKQRGSAITRLFALPTRNQLGHFASYLPFWHSAKADNQLTTPTDLLEDENRQSTSTAAASSSSYSGKTPSILPNAPMSTCSLEYLPYVGTKDDLTLASGMNREKSNSISNFRLRDMSHSPPLSRRQ